MEPKPTPASTLALPPVSSKISEGRGAAVNPEATGCTATGDVEKKPAEAAATAWAPRHAREAGPRFPASPQAHPPQQGSCESPLHLRTGQNRSGKVMFWKVPRALVKEARVCWSQCSRD